MAWLPQFLHMMGVGAAMAAFLLLIVPPRILGYIGTLPWLSANWVSVWRVPVTLLGVGILSTAHGDTTQLWVGFQMATFGWLLDRVDGRIAKSVIARLKVQKELQSISPSGIVLVTVFREAKTAPLNSKGQLWVWFEKIKHKANGDKYPIYIPVLYEDWVQRLTAHHTWLPMFQVAPSKNKIYPGLIMRLTGMGDWIDPLSDKACFIPILTELTLQGYLCPWVVIPMILSDLVSTVFRPPFDKIPGFRYLQRWVLDTKASPFGKTKIIWLLVTMLVLLPALAGWLSQDQLAVNYLIANSVLGLGVISGVVSTLSRLTVWKKLLAFRGFRRFNRKFKKAYEHEVVD